MSDVAYAPAPAAAPAPVSAPAPANEVPIDTGTPNAPAPIGAQTPDKPAGEQPKLGRRESIQRAFDRADKAEPAKARMGHNNPPEPMEKEKPKLDLRKRPADQPPIEATEPAPRARGEHGHFAPAQRVAPEQPQPQRQIAPLPETAPFREAPPRMDRQAQAEWHATPESVRGAVHRMHHEFGRAYEQYRGDHEAQNRIRMFDNLARSQGTTLQRALTNYVSMETKLRNDPVGGLDVIINNLNLRTPEGQKLTLRDICWHVLNQTPEQQQLIQSRNMQLAQNHQLKAAQNRIAQLENHARQMQYQQQFVHTRGALDHYATTHPRLDELGDIIEQEIKLGFDLDTAYRRAEMLRPGNAAPQTRNGTHAAQTRTATAQTRIPDRSISGSAPAGSSNGHARPRGKVSSREAIANAIRAVNGSL